MRCDRSAKTNSLRRHGWGRSLLTEHYHGHSHVPDMNIGCNQNLRHPMVQATVGDSVTEKPPDRVSETLRDREGTRLVSRYLRPDEHTQSSIVAEREVSSAPSPPIGHAFFPTGRSRPLNAHRRRIAAFCCSSSAIAEGFSGRISLKSFDDATILRDESAIIRTQVEQMPPWNRDSTAGL